MKPESALVERPHWGFIVRTIAHWYERERVPAPEDDEQVRWFIEQAKGIAEKLTKEGS